MCVFRGFSFRVSRGVLSFSSWLIGKENVFKEFVERVYMRIGWIGEVVFDFFF